MQQERILISGIKSIIFEKKSNNAFIAVHGNMSNKEDDLQDEKLIKEFCEKFNSELTIMENGEHFFHTKEQMEYYKRWLNEVVCLNPDGLEEKI